MPNLSRIFPQPDRDRIRDAVARAERGTSGEIVPYIVERSDPYRGTTWRCAALSGAVALVVLALLQRAFDFWMPLGLTGVALVGVSSAIVIGLLVEFVPGLKRAFTGNATIARRTAQRAVEAFTSEEVFNTRDRTGILIFLSLLEHRVIVLGDKGINAKVQQSEWDEIVGMIVAGIRSGKPADGLIEAIGTCGTLLARHGVEIRSDDTNELPDAPRFEGDLPRH